MANFPGKNIMDCRAPRKRGGADPGYHGYKTSRITPDYQHQRQLGQLMTKKNGK